jgi:putative aldouronate transport system permease protein
MAKKYKKKSSIKVSTSRKVFLVCNNIFLGLFALICLLPFFNLLAMSLSSDAAVVGGNVSFIPVGFNLGAYEMLLKREAFWSAFGYSILRVVLGTVISLVINVLAAYPLSRPKKTLKGRIFYVIIFVITMFFNGGLVPNFMLITELNIDNTIWALVLPIALNAWNIVLLISFFREVPNELVEAAEMDGASQFQILTKVILPISLPALATVTLFTVVAHWNNWFDGYLYMQPDKYPLQTYIYNFINSVNTEAGNAAAGNNPGGADIPDNPKTLQSAQVFIAMLPIMCVYPFAQKYFIKGLTQGGVKE